jgi:uncharacterized CHY-type Zn-finger protein
MADELIRLDTTIIGIDSLINKASTAEEAKVLFTVKDVIYSQQRYFTDVQPVKRGKWFHSKKNYGFIICSQCKHEAYWDTDYGQQLFDYCPYCGARMMRDGDADA